MVNNCMACVHCSSDFTSDSDGFDIVEWWECGARPKVQNLKQFPFKKTGCPRFAKKATYKPEERE